MTLYFVASSEILFFGWIALTYFTLGGYFSIFPTLSGKVFGMKVGPKIYPLVFTGFAITTVAGSMVAKFLLADIGYKNMFFISSAVTFISFVLLILFREKTLWRVGGKYEGQYNNRQTL